MHRRSTLLRLALAALLAGPAVLLSTPAAAQGDAKACALVLMHGKWSAPQHLAVFARRMGEACTVRNIEMPWAQRRSYDVAYAEALAEIAQQVKTLRADGFKRVVVGGQSFGANAAMAYMAEVGDADAVLALAPGHSPEAMYRRGIGKKEVDEARALVASGKGDEKLTMDDLNQGQRRPMRMRADVLLSYFDPEGLGHMPRSAAGFKRPVPFMWVIGTADPLHAAGEAYAYAKAPAHPASRYVVVEANHVNTPDVAAQQVIDWLKTLP